MNNDIKEKDIVQKSIECLANAKLETTYEVARDIVLDYITNLQEENEKLKQYKEDNFLYDFEELQDKVINLQEENNYFNKKNIEISTLNTSLRSDRDNYKLRIDKAIEYIKNTIFWGIYEDAPMCEVKCGDELLNILTGGDKE